MRAVSGLWVSRVGRTRSTGPGLSGRSPLRGDFPDGPGGVAAFVAARDRWRAAVALEREVAAVEDALAVAARGGWRSRLAVRVGVLLAGVRR